MLCSICVEPSMTTMLLMSKEKLIQHESRFWISIIKDPSHNKRTSANMSTVFSLDTISQELILKDMFYLEGIIDKLEKLVVRGNDKTKVVIKGLNTSNFFVSEAGIRLYDESERTARK